MPLTLAITLLLAGPLVSPSLSTPLAPLVAAADAGRPPNQHGQDSKRSERSRFEAYLADHDVPTAAELQALGKAPEKTLMALSSDAKADGLVRARATAGLRFFPTPEVQTFLAKLIQSHAKTTDATQRLVLRRAALDLGWMVGAGAPDALVLLFDNDDVEVRVDAAIALGLTRADPAVVHLQRRLAVESAPRVRQQIERQLRTMGHPANEPGNAPPPKKETPMRAGW